jgi:phage tail-like protein
MTAVLDPRDVEYYPLHTFNFFVEFFVDSTTSDAPGQDQSICSGAFSECTGLEATMEPKVIKEGGRNYGAIQRPGPVTFGTVILKRGMTRSRDLWYWFDLVNGQHKYAYRLSAVIQLYDVENELILMWRLARVLPIKFKAADLNARATDVGVEELHLAHEGVTLEFNSGGSS